MDQKKRTDVSVLASLAKEKIATDERIIKRASELEKLGFQTMDSAHISYAVYIEVENPVRWLINVFQDRC